MLKRLSDSDRGATALMIAGAMVLIMGLLAIAIDMGFGFDERRADQTATDAAALAGSLELVISDEADGLAAAIDRVYEIVNSNLGRTLDYATFWENCVDPNPLFYTTKTDLGSAMGSDCISLSENFNTFRVRLPEQVLDTNFAPVIGSDTISVSAAAEAERNAEFGGGGNVPFYVLDGTSVGTELCIKTGTNKFASCGDPSSGNFGDFEPYFYGPVGGDLSTICNKGHTPKPLARAVAMGIDHEFSRFAPFPGGTERVNGGWCLSGGIPGPLLPNTIQPGSGYSAQDITNGLVFGEQWPGSQTFDGRLTRNDATVSAQDTGTAFIFGEDIDNRPLWDYIDQSAPGIPASCAFFANPANQGHVPTVPPGDVVTTYNARRAALITCLGDAHSAPSRVLTVDRDGNGTADILETPRVGAAPRIWEDFPPPNNNFHMHIQGLSPIFIDALYAEITNPHFTCAGLDNVTDPSMCTHYAGIDGSMSVSSPGQRVFQSVGAIVLSCEIMPAGACPTLQDPSGLGLTFLYDLQLTR